MYPAFDPPGVAALATRQTASSPPLDQDSYPQWSQHVYKPVAKTKESQASWGLGGEGELGGGRQSVGGRQERINYAQQAKLPLNSKLGEALRSMIMIRIQLGDPGALSQGLVQASFCSQAEMPCCLLQMFNICTFDSGRPSARVAGSRLRGDWKGQKHSRTGTALDKDKDVCLPVSSEC